MTSLRESTIEQADIEVTREMIDAGVSRLRELQETYPEDLLAVEVYKAMEIARSFQRPQ